MGVFNEFIPSQKSSILTFIEQQKTLAEVAQELEHEIQSSSNEGRILPLKTEYEIPKRKSMMEVISQFQRDTEEDLRKSKEIDEKIEKLHNLIESVDQITYFADAAPPEMEKAKKKNDESFLAKPRVRVLKSRESDKKSIKKTPEKVPKKPPVKPREVPKKTPKVTPKSSLTSSIHPPSLSSNASTPSKFKRVQPRATKVSKSVQKILEDAKEKRETNKSQKMTPANVINLQL